MIYIVTYQKQNLHSISTYNYSAAIYASVQRATVALTLPMREAWNAIVTFAEPGPPLEMLAFAPSAPRRCVTITAPILR